MQHKNVGGIELAYELYDFTDPWTTGRPPVVLLHGLGGDHVTWFQQVRDLCREFPVLVVDLRGHGQSSAAETDFTIADMARDVARLVRDCGIDRAHVVGLSMGGMVAQQLALDHRHAVASLVLVDTAAGFGDECAARAREAIDFIDSNTMADVAARRITMAFTDAAPANVRNYFIDRVARNDKTAYERAARATYGFDVRERLGEIVVPTLVLVGNEDRTLPPPFSEEIARQIPDARLVRIDGAAHLSNVERPREVNAAILEFLRGVA